MHTQMIDRTPASRTTLTRTTVTPTTMTTVNPTDDYARIAQAIAFLDAHREDQPTLDDVAAEIGLSPFHCQRLFRRWAGVSPKRFLQAMTAETAKRMLRDGASVLDTAFASGLSGPSRLHDLLVVFEAMTPGEYKRQGAGLDVRYGFHGTPFGEAIVATTDRGVCGLAFTDGDAEAAVADLASRWPQAHLVEAPDATATAASRIFGRSETNTGRAAHDRVAHDRVAPDRAEAEPIHLLVRGTNFQIQVWRALLAVPSGQVTSYGTLALAAGHPRGARAVGTAVGKNPIGFLIPCHRVIRQTGALGDYRWGADRKRAMQVWEAAQIEGAVA